MSLVAAVLVAATFTRSLERVNSMDPIMSQSAYDARAVRLVYETPLEIDYEARPYRLAPGLCELPEVSSDGLVYTLRVRPDSPVTATDVKDSLERLRDVDGRHGSLGRWTMRSVESIEAGPESDRLTIRLKSRQHVFPWFLAMSYAAVHRETGPYRLASWWRNHEMTFERNPSWRGWKDNPKGFDRIRYLVVDDPSTQWLMFLSGEIDCLDAIARDNWGAVMGADGKLDARLAASGVELHGGFPALEVRYIGMNMRDRTLGGNRKLRQAISCAFDFPTWRRFYSNSIDPVNGPVPDGVAGKLERPSPYAWNIEKARRLIAEAGYPDGIDPKTGRRLVLTLSIGRPTQDSREAGELLVSFFAKIGVKLELRFQTWAAFLGAVNNGDCQLYQMAWVGDYPDAENFLQLFHSRNVSPGANHSCYENPEYDAEYDAAMAALTEEERNSHWFRCQEILQEDCPWIFTHVTRNYSLVRSRVKNHIPSDFPYGEEKHLWTEEK